MMLFPGNQVDRSILKVDVKQGNNWVKELHNQHLQDLALYFVEMKVGRFGKIG